MKVKEHPWRFSNLISWSLFHDFFMKWNRNAKTTQIKVNDKGTKIEDVENLKPTGKCPKLAGKHTEIAEKLKNSSKNLNPHWNLTQIIALKCFKKEFSKIQTFEEGGHRRFPYIWWFRKRSSEIISYISSITSLLKSLDFRKFFFKAFEGDYLSEILVKIERLSYVLWWVWGIFRWV